MGMYCCRDNGTYINCLVRLPHMSGMSITAKINISTELRDSRIGEDGDGGDSKFLARGNHSTCNLSAIRNQYFIYPRQTILVCRQWRDMQFMARVLKHPFSEKSRCT